MLTRVDIKDMKAGDLFWDYGPCMKIVHNGDEAYNALQLEQNSRFQAIGEYLRLDSEIKCRVRYDTLKTGETFIRANFLHMKTPYGVVNLSTGESTSVNADWMVTPVEITIA